MWIFTELGFFSAVIDSKDKKTIVVRAREITALQALRTGYDLDKYEITTSYDSDYAFRIRLPHTVWNEVVKELSAAIDYPNFKSAVAKLQGRNNYERALHEVWQVMADTQPTAPYSGFKKGTGR